MKMRELRCVVMALLLIEQPMMDLVLDAETSSPIGANILLLWRLESTADALDRTNER